MNESGAARPTPSRSGGSSSSSGAAPAALSSSSSSEAAAPPLLGTVPATGARSPVRAQRAAIEPTDVAKDESALVGVRQTAEYRAAWDLELWKAIQAERFRVELEKQKARALAQLKKATQEKEKQLRADLKARGDACAAREAKLSQDEAALAHKQMALKAMESDLRRMRQQLLDAQSRVEEEVRAQVRRANDDMAHKAKLLQERVAAAEAQAKRAEERQRLDQQEYLSLYQEFSKFRAAQLSASSSTSARTSRSADAPEGGGSASGQAAVSFYLEQVQQLRAQHTEDLRLTQQRLSQQHQVQLHEAHQRCRELEEQNRRLTAAIARRREQLRKAPRHRDPSLSNPARPGPAPPAASAVAKPAAVVGAAATVSLSVAELVREINRLRTERATLLSDSGGALQPGDGVVRRLDARLAELDGHLAARLAECSSNDGGDDDGAETAYQRIAVR